MSENTGTSENKFTVRVVLVPVKLGEQPKMGVIKDEEGKYLFPNQELEIGQPAECVADSIADSCSTINRNAPYAMHITVSLTRKDELFLVFVYNPNTSQDTFFHKEISFISPEEFVEAYNSKGFSDGYGEIARATIENGPG
tara:strand:- start:86 stop:508 length:423 start_codon:yes stop_codon:yes gene_type:complete